MPMKLQEALAVLTIATILVGLPYVIWHYEYVQRPAAFGEDAQVFTLTGLAAGGKWTTAAVEGNNYWRESFPRVSSLKVDPNRPVVLRLRSADVLHSFSIPALRIRPVDVYPGHETIVRIPAEDLEADDELGFLCYQVCGTNHQHMSGTLLVATDDASDASTVVAAGHGEGR